METAIIKKRKQGIKGGRHTGPYFNWVYNNIFAQLKPLCRKFDHSIRHNQMMLSFYVLLPQPHSDGNQSNNVFHQILRKDTLRSKCDEFVKKKSTNLAVVAQRFHSLTFFWTHPPTVTVFVNLSSFYRLLIYRMERRVFQADWHNRATSTVSSLNLFYDSTRSLTIYSFQTNFARTLPSIPLSSKQSQCLAYHPPILGQSLYL